LSAQPITDPGPEPRAGGERRRRRSPRHPWEPRSSAKHKTPAWAAGPIYAGLRTASAGLNVLGVDSSMRLLRFIGGRYARLPFNRARLERAMDNIQWCFPGWERDRVERTAIEAYRHLLCLGAEVTLSARLLNEDAYSRHVQVGEVAEGLRELCKDQPCLLITGHCGNWELLGYTLALLGFPMHALYRPLDMKPLDDWVHVTRSRRGLTLIDKFGASRILPVLMEQQTPVGFIADQNAGDRGLFVPFFDRLASTYKAIGIMAVRYRAVVLCGTAIRLGALHEISPGAELFQYRLDITDIIRPEDWEGQPDPVFYITARYRRAIETMVRRNPDQYLWMHRYWKTRPAHERAGEPSPPRLRERIEALPWMTPERLRRIVDRSAEDARELARRGTTVLK